VAAAVVVTAVLVAKTMAATAMVGAQTRGINNQLKVAVATAAKTMMEGDSNDNNYDNDGNGGGGGGDGGRRWRWAL
jgi:hypothetical protein